MLVEAIGSRPARLAIVEERFVIPAGAEEEIGGSFRIPSPAEFGEADSAVLENIALGLVNPDPDGILARPTFQPLRRQLIDLAFALAGRPSGFFQAEANTLCRDWFIGRGSANRTRKVMKRALAFFWLVKRMGPEYANKFIAANQPQWSR